LLWKRPLLAVLSDTNMPGMDGLELPAEISGFPTLMIRTDYGDDEPPSCRRAGGGIPQ
jgi:CheY-like chemotaxis protein